MCVCVREREREGGSGNSCNIKHCVSSRNLFRLPIEEKLDGHCECSLWSPHEKAHVLGTLYCSPNYLCFNSKVSSTLEHAHKCFLSFSGVQSSYLVARVVTKI